MGYASAFSYVSLLLDTEIPLSAFGMAERSRDRAHGNYSNVRQEVEGNDEQLHLRSRFPLSNPEQDARTGHQEQKRRTKMGKRQLTKQASQPKATKDRARASQLKREYPHSEIPHSLSRPAFKNLLLRLQQQELPKKAAAKPEKVNSGGISLSNPILID